MNTPVPPAECEQQTRVAVYVGGEFDSDDEIMTGTPRENANRLRERGWIELVDTGWLISLICPGTNLRVTLEHKGE